MHELTAFRSFPHRTGSRDRDAMSSFGGQSGRLAALTMCRAIAGGVGSRVESRTAASNCSRVRRPAVGRVGIEGVAELVADTETIPVRAPLGRGRKGPGLLLAPKLVSRTESGQGVASSKSVTRGASDETRFAGRFFLRFAYRAARS